MKFTKMHGIGNDYIYVNTMEETVADPVSLAVAVSDRHKGIGSDGLILIGRDEDGLFTMDIYNADGSRGMMCGNGIRCVAKYLYDNHYVTGSEVSVKTASGIKKISMITEEGRMTKARVDMGIPVFEPAKVPYDPAFVKDGKIVADGREIPVVIVGMGNPHCVVFLEDEDVDGLDLAAIGPAFENHPAFPEKVNTEFVNIVGPGAVKMRVWERGSGETMACGTGASAAAVAAVLKGFCEEGETLVKLRGGDLEIFWDGSGSVFMTGPAETVCTGEYPA